MKRFVLFLCSILSCFGQGTKYITHKRTADESPMTLDEFLRNRTVTRDSRGNASIPPGISALKTGASSVLSAWLRSGSATIAIIGDSVSEGYAATDRRVNGWAYLVAARLKEMSGDTGPGFIGAHRTDVYTYAGDWAAWTGSLPDGQYTTSAGTVAMAAQTCTSFDIYGQFGNGGIARYSIDGGPVQSVTIDSSTSYHAVVSAGSLGPHTITLAADANNGDMVYFSGIRPIAAATGVTVDNLALSGSSTVEWVSGSLQPLTALAPNFVIISLGINDAGNAVPLSTYTANLSSVVEATQNTGAAVLLLNENPIGANQSAYAEIQAAAKSVAQKYGLDYLSVADRWGTYEQALAAGFMAPTLHPTTSGHADIAAYVLAHLVPQRFPMRRGRVRPF